MAGGQVARLANASPWGGSRAGRCLPRVRPRHVRRTHRDRVYAGARPASIDSSPQGMIPEPRRAWLPSLVPPWAAGAGGTVTDLSSKHARTSPYRLKPIVVARPGRGQSGAPRPEYPRGKGVMAGGYSPPPSQNQGIAARQ